MIKKLTTLSLGLLLLMSTITKPAAIAELEELRRTNPTAMAALDQVRQHLVNGNEPMGFVWDLGDTLLTVDAGKSFKQFGYVNMPAYMLSYMIAKGWRAAWGSKTDWRAMGMRGFKEHMKELFLGTLSKIPSHFPAPDYEILGVNGKPLPPLQRDFLLGKLTGKEVCTLIDGWIDKNQNAFAHQLQRSVFRANCDLYFAHYVDVAKYTKLFDLFKKCHEATDEHGNRLHTNVILSNWQKDGIENLKATFPELFECSDMQVFSGLEGLAKPHPALFEKIKQHFANKQNQKWFFFDDQQNNLDATPAGITPVHVDKAAEVLKQHGIQ